MWCEIYSHGPYFLESTKRRTITVNAEQFKVILETFCAVSYILVNKICCGSNMMEQMLIQQKFPCKSSELFPGRLISHFGDITWPARSPEHAVSYYFVWGYLKSKVYETRPANIADLKQRILECIQGNPKEMLQHVMTAFPSRLQECIE